MDFKDAAVKRGAVELESRLPDKVTLMASLGLEPTGKEVGGFRRAMKDCPNVEGVTVEGPRSARWHL